MVYADMLSERGDPRGEYIQLQCRSERGPCTAGDADREGELLRAHAREWLDPIWQDIALGSVRFRRGFLRRCLVKDDRQIDPALLPWRTVEHLDLELFREETEETRQWLDALAEMPRLQSLSSVHPRALAGSSLAGKLHRFELRLSGLPGEADFDERVEHTRALPTTCGLSFELRRPDPGPDVADAQWQALCEAGLGERCVGISVRSLRHLGRWLRWMNSEEASLPSLTLRGESWLWGREGEVSLTLERSGARVSSLRADAGGSDPLAMQAAVRAGLDALLGALAELEGSELDELTLFPRLPYLCLRERDALELLEQLTRLQVRVTRPEIRLFERAVSL